MRAVRFGVFQVDLATGELRRNGLKINLQEQPFQVLSLLLSRPGELVTREDLQRQVWPADTFVDFDLGLNTAIKKIREALGDSARNPRFVETLPKRGYRFIAAVEKICEDPGGPAAALAAADEGPEKAAPPAEASPAAAATRQGKQKLLRRAWLAAAVLAAAIGALSLRQFKAASHHGAAVNSTLKGWSYLNDAYDMADKNDRAVEAFEAAVRLDRDYAPAYAGLGEAYFRKFVATRQDQWAEKAEAACSESLQVDGNLPAGFNCMGTVELGRGRYENAIDDFSRAIKLDSGNLLSFRGRAEAYEGRNMDKDLRLAEQDYLHALELAPDNWRSHAFLAAFYHRQARDCESIAEIQQAITARPDNSEPMARLGALYIEIGSYDEAITTLERAIRLSPSFAAYENLGTAYLDRHDFAKAIDSFKNALALRPDLKSPDDYIGHGNLARAYSWGREPGLARLEYEQAIALAKQQLEVNPKDLDANLSLSIYYAKLGQRADSRNQLDVALALEPQAPETKFWAMVVELQLGNKEKAMAWLPDALKYSPSEVQAAPELEGLRRDPAFQGEMERAKSDSVQECKPN